LNRGKDTVFAYSFKGSPDLDGDNDVDLLDFAAFAAQWLQSGCTSSNDWCQGCDIDHSGEVGPADLLEITENWF
jgi:hypothetical protein